MSAVDRGGSVEIIRGGVVQTVPYRQAVGLVSTGRASWAPVAAAVEPLKRKRAKTAPEPAVALVSEQGPELVNLPPGAVSVSWSDVSTPTQKGAEGDKAGNEPPPVDP